jgi:nitrate/nitrite transporter NarK
VTSFSIPSAVFEKDIRSTFNGIAAAMGKFGAAVGAFMFAPMAEYIPYGYTIVMGFCCVATIAGAYISHYILEIPSDDDVEIVTQEVVLTPISIRTLSIDV